MSDKRTDSDPFHDFTVPEDADFTVSTEPEGPADVDEAVEERTAE